MLLDNAGGNVNGWLSVELNAQQAHDSGMSQGGRVNPRGIGSLLEIKVGRSYVAQLATRSRTHFGLGQHEAADVLRVLWTDGIPNNAIAPKGRQTICEVWRLKGSCPYLYTWTGERFEFFTDLLWAAPLGLQFAEGVYAVPRADEYLVIPAERLRPRGDTFELVITEELWEAGYFDRVELIAVDHPADVEIVSNEKVGPPAIAEFKIHTLRSPRSPVSARDSSGRDLLERLRDRDAVFAHSFSRRIRQGLVDENFLEIDLGSFEPARTCTLFLTGWVYPTDTSINVSLSQNPSASGPKPPSLWVVDQSGRWKEAMPFMGFPGGKTKTIAVDLSGVFESADHRLRIVSSMELYWDSVAFTADEPPAELKLLPLSLESAELRYRGFSAWTPGENLGPERYHFDRVATEPIWPPMGGRFTRYGDVGELLAATDDRLVVMGAGDAVRLQFRVPDAQSPSGWKRDFLIHSAGWDKDADLNTIYGQTVEPLPFGTMSGYPYWGSECYPDTPRHREYLMNYQTRTQSGPQFWRLVHSAGSSGRIP